MGEDLAEMLQRQQKRYRVLHHIYKSVALKLITPINTSNYRR